MSRLPCYRATLSSRYHPYASTARRLPRNGLRSAADHSYDAEDQEGDGPPPVGLRAATSNGDTSDTDVPTFNLDAPAVDCEGVAGDEVDDRRRRLFFLVLDIMATMRRKSIFLRALDQLCLHLEELR